MSDEITVPTAATDSRPWYLDTEIAAEDHRCGYAEVTISDARRDADEQMASAFGADLPAARALAWRICTLLNDEEEGTAAGPRLTAAPRLTPAEGKS